MDQELKKYLAKQFKNVATKDDLKDVVRTKDLDKRLMNFATKDDIKGLVTKEDLDKRLANFATKDDLARGLVNVATKDDLNDAINELVTFIDETIAQPLERHIAELSDYPVVRRDVKRIKHILHLD